MYTSLNDFEIPLMKLVMLSKLTTVSSCVNAEIRNVSPSASAAATIRNVIATAAPSPLLFLFLY